MSLPALAALLKPKKSITLIAAGTQCETNGNPIGILTKA